MAANLTGNSVTTSVAGPEVAAKRARWSQGKQSIWRSLFTPVDRISPAICSSICENCRPSHVGKTIWLPSLTVETDMRIRRERERERERFTDYILPLSLVSGGSNGAD